MASAWLYSYVLFLPKFLHFLGSLNLKMSARCRILYKNVFGWIFRPLICALLIKSLVKLARRIRGWFLGTSISLMIEQEWIGSPIQVL